MSWNAEEDFRYSRHGRVTLSPGFELVVTSGSPLNAAGPGLRQFYSTFTRRFAANFTFYATGTMTSWRKVTEKALRMAPEWLAEPRNLTNADLELTFHSGPSGVELVPPALRLNLESGASYVAAMLPANFVASGAEPALELIRETVASDFRLSAGWAGYAIVWNEAMGPLASDAKAKLRTWLQSHPGFGHGSNEAIAERALHGISNVSWLTLLGAELSERKGGADAIAHACAQLSPEIKVHPLGAGVCIQAGQVPQIGDVNRGDTLPLYRQLGAYLKDLRTTEPPRFLYGFENDSEDWFARFDA